MGRCDVVWHRIRDRQVTIASQAPHWHSTVVLLGCALALPLCAAAPFAALSIRVERNVSDQDHEVVIEITSGSVGLATLKIVTPDGRTLLDLKAPDSKLGLRHLVIESPEPKSLAALHQEYPAGSYSFSGTTSAGVALTGTVMLEHQLPGPVRWLSPSTDNSTVAARGLSLQWVAAQGARSLALAIEDEKSGVKVLQVMLPASTLRFSPPDGSLKPGTVYKASIGAIGANGNASYVETTFTTARP